MAPYLFSSLSFLVRLAFAIPVLLILLRLYTRTQMKSFLWLIAALVAWPMLALGSSTIMPIIVRQMALTGGLVMGQTISIFGAVYLVEALIGGTLLVVSIFMLERDLISRMQAPAPAAPGL